MNINGIWLPIVTPFLNGEVDYKSYVSLINYYIDKKISGIIPMGTTGECPVLDENEFLKITEITIETVNNRVPVLIGLGGNYTNKVIKQLKSISRLNFQGILSVSPYYNRPDQLGIYEHFRTISESTDKDIVIYNIPYRTGRNIENETLLRLAELTNITGVKDSCGSILQSMELIFNKPEGFSVLTGEDVHFYTTLLFGGDGGILAASHFDTEEYISVYDFIKNNNHEAAKEIWKNLSVKIPLFFKEPNPAPIKYLLEKYGLISNCEVRLPMIDISDTLKRQLDNIKFKI